MSPFTPRAWQVEAARLWDQAGGRGVMSVVTGGGKTFLAFHMFDAIRRTNPRASLVVLVPSIALLDQWAIAAQFALGLRSEDIALFSGESFAPERAIMNVAVLNTARARDLPPGNHEDTMLVVDECHRAGAPINARALRLPARYTLGLSATPEREFDDGFARYVEPRLGSIVYEYDYRQARKDGVIVNFTLHNYRVKRSRRGREAESPHRVAATAVIADGFGGRRLVFSERISAADRTAELISKRGARAAAYHSHLGPAIRRRNLELFRTGQFDTLVTCRALDEGVDVPLANAAVISAGTASLRQRIQRVGRVLRLAEGKSRADVATLYATDEEAQRLAQEAEALEEVAATRWYEVAE